MLPVQDQANVWLVNTGWTGGAYGEGTRIKLKHTRAIIDAIHSGALAQAPTVGDPHFGVQVVQQCPDVPNEILVPRNTWKSGAAYDQVAAKLAGLFIENFEKYSAGVSEEVRKAGPARST